MSESSAACRNGACSISCEGRGGCKAGCSGGTPECRCLN
jgi:hypothetical protein